MSANALRTLAIRVAPLIFAAGLAHLGFQIFKHWNLVTLDFRFFWLAGEFWASGQNPYGAEYAAEAADRFDIKHGAIWYYAPNWFPLAAFLSLPDPLAASRLWLVSNAALLVAASGFSVASFRAMRGKSAFIDSRAEIAQFLAALPDRTLLFMLAGGLALTQAAGNTLHLGQCSMLIYFGGSLLIFGAAHSKLAPAVAGLAILMLKPQIGVLVGAALIATKFGRRTIAIAAIATILAAAPAFAAISPAQIFAELAGGIAQYSDQAYNMAPAVTGLRHLAWIAGGPDFGPAFYMGLAVALVAAVAFFSALRPAAFSPADLAVAAITIAIATVPLHVYDLILLGAVALFAVSVPRPASALALAAFALAWRAGNLPPPAAAALDNVVYYPGGLYASLGAIAIAGVMIFSLGVRRVRGAPGLARA
jgi:hypothetical protein